MHFRVFFVCTLLLLSVPYQRRLYTKSQACDWEIMKHFSYMPVPSWADPVPTLSRSFNVRVSLALRIVSHILFEGLLEAVFARMSYFV